MRAAKEVYKALGIPDRIGYTQAQASAHCSFPASVQSPDVQAFVDKFLLNKSGNTNVARDSYNTNLTSDGSSLTDEPRGESEGAWLQPHWVGDLTLSAFNTYTGTDLLASSVMDLGAITPLDSDWNDGTRDVSCYAYRIDGSALNRSIKRSS